MRLVILNYHFSLIIKKTTVLFKLNNTYKTTQFLIKISQKKIKINKNETRSIVWVLSFFFTSFKSSKPNIPFHNSYSSFLSLSRNLWQSAWLQKCTHILHFISNYHHHNHHHFSFLYTPHIPYKWSIPWRNDLFRAFVDGVPFNVCNPWRNDLFCSLVDCVPFFLISTQRQKKHTMNPLQQCRIIQKVSVSVWAR